jgi:hypothetical protein
MQTIPLLKGSDNFDNYRVVKYYLPSRGKNINYIIHHLLKMWYDREALTQATVMGSEIMIPPPRRWKVGLDRDYMEAFVNSAHLRLQARKNP